MIWMCWDSACFFCCQGPKTSPHQNPPNNQAFKQPNFLPIIPWKLPKTWSNPTKSSLTPAFEARNWQMFKGRPSPWGLWWIWSKIDGPSYWMLLDDIGCISKKVVKYYSNWKQNWMYWLCSRFLSFILFEKASCCFLFQGISYLSFCGACVWKVTIWCVDYVWRNHVFLIQYIQGGCLSWYWKIIYLLRGFLPSKGCFCRAEWFPWSWALGEWMHKLLYGGLCPYLIVGTNCGDYYPYITNATKNSLNAPRPERSVFHPSIFQGPIGRF